MTNDDFYAVSHGELPINVADIYLKIYVAQIDWMPHLETLWKDSQRKNRSNEQMRSIIACTILLPYIDKTTKIDSEHPESLLLKMPYFHQLQDRNWFELLQKTINEDDIIDLNRTKVLGLGVISKIKYDPISRQAFNWLYIKAEDSGIITPDNKEDIVERFTNLVMAYGGAAICNIFSRHSEKLKKVLNWRTGYFFERLIYDVYSIDEILKIKQADLQRANPTLVKQILIGAR
jgi:hypothetical protein